MFFVISRFPDFELDDETVWTLCLIYLGNAMHVRQTIFDLEKYEI